MSHTNAALTPRHRLKVAQLVVDKHWPIREVAARFQVSWPTVQRWGLRYHAGESMQDRPSRPPHCPHKTDRKNYSTLRLRLRERPVQLTYRLGISASTVHRILRGAHLNRLSYTDRVTGEPIRKYEHDHRGSIAACRCEEARQYPLTAVDGVTSAVGKVRDTVPQHQESLAPRITSH